MNTGIIRSGANACYSCSGDSSRVSKTVEELSKTLKEMRLKYPVPVEFITIRDLLHSGEISLGEAEAFARTAPLIIDFYRRRRITLERVKREGLGYEEYARLVTLAGRISPEAMEGMAGTLMKYVKPFQLELELSGRDAGLLLSLEDLSRFMCIHMKEGKAGLVVRPGSGVEFFIGDVAWRGLEPPVRSRIVLLGSKGVVDAPTPILPVNVAGVASPDKVVNRISVTVDVAEGVVSARGPGGEYTTADNGLPVNITEWPVPDTSRPGVVKASFNLPGEYKEMALDLLEYYVSYRGLLPRIIIGEHLILVGPSVFDERHQVLGELLRRGMIRVREPVLLDYTRGNGAELLLNEFAHRLKGPLKGIVASIIPDTQDGMGVGELVLLDEAGGRVFTSTAYTLGGGGRCCGEAFMDTLERARSSIAGYIRVPRAKYFYYDMAGPVLVTSLNPGVGHGPVAILSGSQSEPSATGYTRILLYPVMDEESTRILRDHYIVYGDQVSESRQEPPLPPSGITGSAPVYWLSMRRHGEQSRLLARYIEVLIARFLGAAELLTCDWHCTIEEEYTVGDRWAIRVSKTKYSLYSALVDREAHRTLDWIRYRQASGDAPITVTLAVLTLAEAEPHPLAILKHRGEQAYYILPPRPVAEAITSVSPLA